MCRVGNVGVWYAHGHDVVDAKLLENTHGIDYYSYVLQLIITILYHAEKRNSHSEDDEDLLLGILHQQFLNPVYLVSRKCQTVAVVSCARSGQSLV